MAAQTHDIFIEQGSTFRMRLRPASATVDFTGSTFRGQIRKTAAAADVIAEFLVTTGNDGTSYYDLTLTAALTAAIPTLSNRTTVYRYDVEALLADGRVIRLIQGSVTVYPEVTK